MGQNFFFSAAIIAVRKNQNFGKHNLREHCQSEKSVIQTLYENSDQKYLKFVFPDISQSTETETEKQNCFYTLTRWRAGSEGANGCKRKTE